MSTKYSKHESVTAPPPARRGRGRPRDLDKREAILQSASDLFHERGIAATTMEAVAERAGVSKMTVYANFPDKPALLAAVFERTTKSFRLPELAGTEDLTSSITHLEEFGVRLIGFLTRPEIVKSAKMMAEAADQYPELAAAFYTAGPAAMLAKVSAFLRSLVDHRLIAIEDPELAAEQLITAWLGMTQLRQNLGLAGPPSMKEISKRVGVATRTVFRAWSTAK
jgi:TetR/AcrR family transcriptional regulator, mexJK operon transcriptional repressor